MKDDELVARALQYAAQAAGDLPLAVTAELAKRYKRYVSPRGGG
jgi:hypothetical protein